MLSLRDLQSAVSRHSVARRVRRLQPAFGRGDKIFPPTYAAAGEKGADKPIAQHCFERRFVEERGELVCCLLDSVQSQANRIEECLADAVTDGAIQIPYAEVDFSGHGLEIVRITTLEAPHRIYDALLRDSLLDGMSFLDSPVGRRVVDATSANATAMLEISPTTLLLGGWHSQGLTGGMGAKFQRCMQSEVIAVNVPVDITEPSGPGGLPEMQTAARRTSSRRDPALITTNATVWKSSRGWSTSQEEAGEGAIEVNPSEINHGNIVPTIVPAGITMEYGEQRGGVSFSALRRLQFGSKDKNLAARTYLAAIALLGATERDARGHSYRSGCDLVLDCDVVDGRWPASWQFVGADGKVEDFEVDRDGALDLYNKARQAAQAVGFNLYLEPIRLIPQPKLVQIMLQSRDSDFRKVEDAGSQGDE